MPRVRQADRDRFLMAAHDAAEADRPLTMFQIADAVGLSREQAKRIVDHLQDRKLVCFHSTPLGPFSDKPLEEGREQDDGEVEVTTLGVEYIEQLRLPLWKRWIREHSELLTLVIGLIAALAAVLGAVGAFRDK